MSTIKGIFEPFYEFVTTQLNLRKAIIGEGSQAATIAESQEDINSEGEETSKINPLERSKSFFAYTTQKQCTIRMASGVDVRKENDLLNEHEYHLTGPELARNWVLEGGIKHQGMDRGGGLRSGLSEGINPSTAYGDWSIRSDAADGFGIVPMPGIVDATIDTKSDNGSLREAKVNFVCHNRRQLEVLEALYMRPGYPILLEWGWVPYISNDMTLENDNPSILDEFMDAGENLNSLNLKIYQNKITTGGNYDGFIGFCKNFSFKVREDGGYDCVTEIIAHGEILESLKTPITLAPKLLSTSDTEALQAMTEGKIPTEYESIDRFLFYLRAIKTNLDSAGDQASLNYIQTNREKEFRIELGPYSYGKTGFGFDTYVGINKEVNYGTEAEPLYPIGSEADANAALIQSSYVTNTTSSLPELTGVIADGFEQTYGIFYGYHNEDGELIPIHKLNTLHTQYADGYDAVKKLVVDVSKVPMTELDKQDKTWEAQLINTDEEHQEARSGEMKKTWYGMTNKSKHIEAAGLKMRNLATAGLDPILEGTILKEISTEDENENDSGIRKKIFVRWDLICQILNRKVTPQYKKDHALVELTYLNPNQPTFKAGDNPLFFENPNNNVHYKEAKNKKWKGGGYYLDYSKNTTEFSSRGLTTSEKVEGGGEYTQKDADDFFSGKTENLEKVTIDSLGQSFDRNVCLMPHQIKAMEPYLSGGDDSDPFIINPFTSFASTTNTNYSIGMVYFNLDYLLSTYEELALETIKTDENGVEKTKRRIKNKFSFHDWITTIWEGVNDACGGYYNFGLHTEHSRPHVVRVIDFTFSGTENDLERPIFQFDPQGLGSISRESSYSSKLDNDFASVISIAAQSPINIHSLEAMSFKAFHKNVKNRFTTIQDEQETIDNFHTDMERSYKADVKQYNDALLSLDFYMLRMNKSNYETELVKNTEDQYRKPMSPSVAKNMASRLEEMQHSIDSRHPEKEGNVINNNSKGEANPDGNWVGTYRSDTTFNRSAIIPITVSMTIDGIGGIHPLQIFKVNKEKLPLGYQNKDIVFVVKKETQSITSGQDWTTSLNGYLTLLNTNPNLGENTDEYLDSDTNDQSKKLDDIDPPPSPNADKLRSTISFLSGENFKIIERQKAKSIDDPNPQLSSNGDITPELVTAAEKIFMSLANMYKDIEIDIEITGGNDKWHQVNKPSSSHVKGTALDFIINPYNELTTADIENLLSNSPNVNWKNEYKALSQSATGGHFHINV